MTNIYYGLRYPIEYAIEMQKRFLYAAYLTFALFWQQFDCRSIPASIDAKTKKKHHKKVSFTRIPCGDSCCIRHYLHLLLLTVTIDHSYLLTLTESGSFIDPVERYFVNLDGLVTEATGFVSRFLSFVCFSTKSGSKMQLLLFWASLGW